VDECKPLPAAPDSVEKEDGVEAAGAGISCPSATLPQHQTTNAARSSTGCDMTRRRGRREAAVPRATARAWSAMRVRYDSDRITPVGAEAMLTRVLCRG